MGAQVASTCTWALVQSSWYHVFLTVSLCPFSVGVAGRRGLIPGHLVRVTWPLLLSLKSPCSPWVVLEAERWEAEESL
jgi:hypothetical protein